MYEPRSFSWPDQIYPRMLWEASKEIVGALALMYESLLNCGEVLDDWRVDNDSLFRRTAWKSLGL